MHKTYLILAAVFGGLAVAIGAFGAHGLHQLTADEKIINGFHTGAQYQMYHALALLAVGILYSQFGGKTLRWAAICFTGGIFLFSGSLYLITFLKIHGSAATRLAGPVTPLGGVLFIMGWLFLVVSLTASRKS